MVKRDNSKEAFTHRLIDACSIAGLTGHGRNKRIADAIKKNGGSISTPGVWKWFNAQAIPDSVNIMILSKTLGVRAEWLEYGVGSPTGGNREVNVRLDYGVDNVYRVEVLDVEASAGPGTLVSTDFIESITAIEFDSEQAKALFNGRTQEQVRMITVRGDSMDDTLCSGERVFVDIKVRTYDGDGIYVFVFDSNLHIKRLQMHKDRLLVLSDNPRYKEWYIEEDDLDRFYVMAKVLLGQTVAYKRFG